MRSRETLGLLFLAGLLVAAAGVSLSSGRYPVGIVHALRAVRLWWDNPAAAASDPIAVVLFSLRLPRLAAGINSSRR